jgi:hypothetical protein
MLRQRGAMLCKWVRVCQAEGQGQSVGSSHSRRIRPDLKGRAIERCGIVGANTVSWEPDDPSYFVVFLVSSPLFELRHPNVLKFAQPQTHVAAGE